MRRICFNNDNTNSTKMLQVIKKMSKCSQSTKSHIRITNQILTTQLLPTWTVCVGATLSVYAHLRACTYKRACSCMRVCILETVRAVVHQWVRVNQCVCVFFKSMVSVWWVLQISQALPTVKPCFSASACCQLHLCHEKTHTGTNSFAAVSPQCKRWGKGHASRREILKKTEEEVRQV